MRKSDPVILFAAGVLASAGGAAVLYIEQGWSWLAAGLILPGGAALVSGWLGHRKPAGSGGGHGNWRRAGCVLLASVLIVVFWAVVNYAAVRSAWRRDVTRDKQHTLSANTAGFIKSLPQEVQFSALYVGIPPAYLEDLFREYERVSGGKIKTEIIDPVEQIGYAAQFGNRIDSQESKVVVRSGKERRDVDFTKEPLSEAQLTNAVVRVTRAERQACFLAGHGEYALADKGEQGLSKLVAALAANNISSREVMLGIAGQVPGDCDVLVVPGPHQELTAKEELAIGDYLKRGGDALFLVENVVVTTPDRPLTEEEFRKNPSLNGILNPWGVKVGDDVVVDLVNHAGDDVGSPATRNYEDHKALTAGLDYTFYVRPRSISVLKDRRPELKLAQIVMTMPGEKSWAETDRTLKVEFDPLVDIPGPVPLAFVIMAEKKAPVLSDTRIIVFSDADFLSNAYIDQYSNARMGLNAIIWLAETDALIYIDPKAVKVERLDLTSKQKRQVAAILFLMPLFLAAAGLITWMKRSQ
ncbi:MAG: GldG family protein [Candidatus Omnitrophica bacterium]|nr:GldG family protein [Candidatus Omnitrophota bacterium]